MEFVQMYRGYSISKKIGGVKPLYFASANGKQVSSSYNLKALKETLRVMPNMNSLDMRDSLVRPTERD
jgi:hypothetical protein